MAVNPQGIALTIDNFQAEVLEAEQLVLVDCWANWCGSFQRMNPVYSQLAYEFDGQIKLGRLNIATAEHLAARYGIRAVPTLLVFQGGQVVERLIGHASRPELLQRLQTQLQPYCSSRSTVACL